MSTTRGKAWLRPAIGVLFAASCLIGPAQAIPLTDFPAIFAAADVRPIDGSYANAGSSTWNTVGTQLRRVAPADYADGLSALAGAGRPSPRELSNRILAQSSPMPSPVRATDFTWAFGQLLAHDLDLTPTNPAPDEAAPIPVAADDPINVGQNAQIPFQRSIFDPSTGASTPRQQTNQITGWIDASFVYGSDVATLTGLRANDGSGKLTTGPGNLLPVENGLFVAGDTRANEHAALSGLHALFLREHNRLADHIGAAFATDGLVVTDDQIFHAARDLLIGEVQAITYNDYLPALLGAGAIATYDPFTSFRTDRDPSISSVFSTAAFRVGHTQLSDAISFVAADGAITTLPLQDCFFNPGCLQSNSLEDLFRGLASTPAQQIDAKLTDAVRNFLIGGPGMPTLLDLGAANINRGRDHGLPSYEALRSAFGLAETPLDLLLPAEVLDAYRNADGEIPDGIDAWIGMISEAPFGTGMVGELIHAVLVEQFTLLRDADPYFYARAGRFDAATVAWLNEIRLSDLILWNTDISDIQRTVFFLPAEAAAVPAPATPVVLGAVALLVMGGRRIGRQARR
jgi:peroxidase